ncbi:MAG: hypothetical protein EOO28_24010, partial [Comamonadaceae bacterium]
MVLPPPRLVEVGAPTLPTACGSLPPQGASPAVRQSRACGWRDRSPHAPHCVWFAAPSGGVA